MSGNDHLKPINISDITWLYAERKGLCVVHRFCDTAGNLMGTDTFYLPWRVVEKAMAVRPKPRRSR